MNIPLIWIFPVLAVQRLVELWLSRRNLRRLAARGGREFHPETFRDFAVLHSLFLLALLAESFPWRVPWDLRTQACLAAAGLLMAGRYWCIACLGECWNTRIVVVPGAPRVSQGPYRWLRHPNYLVVALEFLCLPLLLRSPLTLAVFFPLNLILLRRRIRLEEEALGVRPGSTNFHHKGPRNTK